MSKPTVLKQPPMALKVADVVATLIITGDMSLEEETVSEVIIAKRFGVSRMTAREAVKILISKGLVSSKQRAGISVLPFSHWNLFDQDVLRWIANAQPKIAFLRDFSQFRLSIEPEAAYLAANNRDTEALKEIAGIAQELTATERAGLDTAAQDIRFHLTILRCTNNAFFNYIANVLEPAYQICITSNINIGRNSTEKSTALDHKKVSDCILSHRPEDAKNAMAGMIKRDVCFLEKCLQNPKEKSVAKTSL